MIMCKCDVLRFRRYEQNRRGAAVVEFAIVLPLIVLILVGSIDLGQVVYVSQVVNEVSREAARQAARNDTADQTAVDTKVKNYLRGNSVGMSQAAMSVNFYGSDGTAVAGGNLTSISPGSRVIVEVTLDYDSVRWLTGVPALNGKQITTRTVMRRE